MNSMRCVLVVLMVLPSVTLAGEKELKNALSKAQYMLRQSTAEKASLEEENRKVQAAFDEYRKNAEKERKQYAKGSKQQAQQLSAKIDNYKEHYEELKNKFVTLRKSHMSLQDNQTTLSEKLSLEQKKFSLCVANNHKLFEVNKEILAKYENKGLFSVLKQNEPMMGLSKVQIENLVQEYQYENEDLLVIDY